MNTYIQKCMSFLKQKKVFSLLSAMLIYISLYKSNVVQTYGIGTFLILFVVYYFIYHVDFNKVKKQHKKVVCLVSVFLAILCVLGMNTVLYFSSETESVVRHFLSIKGMYLTVGYTLLFYILSCSVLPYLLKLKFNEPKPFSNTKLFFASLCCMLVIWTIYFLVYFPGILTPDSFKQLGYVINNLQGLTDHHPILHTILIYIPYQLGYRLSHNISIGVAVAIVCQMMIMACIFSYMLVFLNKEKVSKKIVTFFACVYIFSPLYGYYSITMWKDILFGTVFSLFLILLYKMMKKRNHLQRNDYLLFWLSSLVLVFLRNNAIYMYIFFYPFALYYFKKNWKSMLILLSSIVVIFYVVKGPVFNALHIKNTSSSEYIGIPLQQLGRITYQHKDLSSSQKEKLDQLMPIEKWEKVYNPVVSDGIKFDVDFDIEIFNQHKMDYALLWGELMLRYPNIAIDGYLTSTVGYWYPDFNYWTVIKVTSGNEWKVSNTNYLGSRIKNVLYKLDSKEIPILNMQWSIGTCVWLIFLLFILCMLRKEKEKWLLFIPVLGIWITMMLASPVSGEFRYVFGFFTSLPLLVSFPFMNLKGEVYEKRIKEK